MRVAYLILAHHQPEHLARLMRALNCEWAHFFIHIDGNVDIASFQRQLAITPNVSYLTGADRVKVYWGGYSHVQASLNLLRCARTSPIRFHRYVLLTGSDYPIKTRMQIHAQLSTVQEFISVDRRATGDPGQYETRYIGRYHLPDNRWLHQRMVRARTIARIADRLVATIPRKLYRRVPLYFGSAYWALTNECVSYILDFLQKDPTYDLFFKYTLMPAELFFQSLVKISPFASKIVHDLQNEFEDRGPPGSTEYGSHYIDWSGTSGVAPKILGSADLPALEASAAIFARKFDTSASASLLDELDRIITRNARRHF
jgi:Core-2/I-Branching enzyme